MANEYLKRTPTSSGNRKVWTWAGWVKRNGQGSTVGIFGANGGSNDTDLWEVYFSGGNKLGIQGNNTTWRSTTRVIREASAWYHIVIVYNSTSINASDRYKVFINGKQETDFAFQNNPSINALNGINQVATHIIGARTSSNDYNKAQFNDVFLVDGQALTPDVFGFYKDGDGYMSSGTSKATDFRPGQWSPHSPSKIKKDINRSGGFGVNGFYLPMNDSSNPGADFHMTPNSIIKLKGEDLPQPQNGAPTTSDAFVSQLREEQGTLGFDGCVKIDAGDYLTVPSSSDFAYGTGDFTWEAFVFSSALSNDSTSANYLFDHGSDGGMIQFYDGLIRYYNTTTGASGNLYTKGGGLQTSTWHHVAVARQSGTTRLFVDGQLRTSQADTHNYSAQAVTIGDYGGHTGSNEWDGFISNLRLIKGTALYTSNFTPPTEPLTNITNTKLLCCNSSTSATASTVTPGTITANGNAFATRNELTGSIVLAVPGIAGGQGSGYGDYSADIRGSGSNKTTTAIGNGSGVTSTTSYYGSAMTFGGSSDFIDVTEDGSSFDFDGDFTIEFWVKPNSSANNDLVGTATNQVYLGAGKSGWIVGYYPGGGFRFGYQLNGSWVFEYSTGVATNSNLNVNQWYHIAITRSGTTQRYFVNGVVVDTRSSTSALISTQDHLRIGGGSGSTSLALDGSIQDLRIYKGVAKYKGGFDVPKPYTPVGIEAFRTTADTCKNNFATFNPLIGAGTASGDNVPNLKDGNLFLDTANQTQTQSSIGMSSGKWYCEYRLTSSSVAAGGYYGVVGDELAVKNNNSVYASSGFGHIRPGTGQNSYTKDWTATSLTTASPTLGYASGDIFGFALDLDSSPKNIKYYRNDTLIHTDSTIGDSGHYYFLAIRTNDGASGVNWPNVYANFGQNPSFSGTVTAGTNTDDSGKGLFKYAPPSGFLALCEDNLPTPAIADPGEHFKTVLYEGDGGLQSVNGVGFQPDFVWIKSRTSNHGHAVFDVNRGIERLDAASTQEGRTNEGNIVISSDGFDITSSHPTTNNSGSDMVAWCWKAGGAAVSNSDGSITSQVSVNQDAGFSIVSYTGNNTTNTTIGHGLGKAPTFILSKSLNQSGTPTVGWGVFHVGGSYNNSILYLAPGTAGKATDTNVFTTTTQTDSVFTIGDWTGINENGKNYIAYCWTEIEGFSKFGSYKGNGSDDGTFVYCGFKPAFVMVKNIDTTNNWYIHDSSRDSTNPALRYLMANSSLDETAATTPLDILSNGFKLRNGSYDGYNGAYTYVFAAFAESPFQTANAK